MFFTETRVSIGLLAMARIGLFVTSLGLCGAICRSYGGLMVSALDCGARGSGPKPGWGHFCCILGQDTSNSASLHPGVQMGTVEFNAWGNPSID